MNKMWKDKSPEEVFESMLKLTIQPEEDKERMLFISETTMVSTLKAGDTGLFETGISWGDKTIVVQQYSSKAEAIKGHMDWCKKADSLTYIEDYDCPSHNSSRVLK
jgi:hypothetical protein